VGTAAPADTTGGDPGTPGAGLAGAAVLIAVLTVASRLAGFARTLVFGHSVGATTLGGVYLAANTLPNIVFEIVAGGALAALVVPLVAGPIARGDRARAGATASALLTWVLLALVPLAVLLAVLAHPVLAVLKPGAPAAVLDSGTRMLRVFAPQLPLYGVGIVLTGVLQAHRRFAWPVLAPLLSSLTVMGAYLTFAAVAGRGADLPAVGRTGELVLSAGTTAGVVVLSLCLVPPVRRLRLAWAPRLRFAPGQAASVRALAGVGVVTVASQQLSLLLVIVLTGPAALVLFTLAQTVYLLPWAVLAVPLATSAYPVLARSFATGDDAGFAGTLGAANRAVLLTGALGAAALVALAGPGAVLLGAVTAHVGPAGVGTLRDSLIAFAPGLPGYGLFALHSRALYARGRNRAAAVATLAGWGAVVAASLVAAAVVPAGARVPALAAANSAGMVLLGAVLLVLVRRRAGTAALAGTGRVLAAGLVAAVVAAGAGIAVRLPLPATPGPPGAAGQGMLSAVVVCGVFAALVALLARADVAPLAGAVARRIRRARRGADRGDTGEPEE